MDAFAGGVPDELEDVRALERIAAGEDEERNLKVGDLVDEVGGLVGGELAGVGQGLRGGAAVLTGEVAGLRGFPDGEERRAVVVECGHGLADVHGIGWQGWWGGGM